MRTRADAPTKNCTEPGCPKPLKAKDLCTTHYNQRYCPTRHPKVTVPCDWCGKSCIKDKGREKRYAGLFCSLDCRDAWRSMRAGTNVCLIPESHPAHPKWSLPSARLPAVRIASNPTVRQPPPRRFVAGTCGRCGSPFLAEDYTDTARYCSLRCAKQVGKQRYRARKRRAYVADVSPARIFERDGWRCKLCHRKVRRDAAVPHPLAPVLDHIVPLARGGTHEPANVQCAHFLCNSRKSDSARYAEQLLLVG